MHANEDWTPLHAAARIACGDALDGESGNMLERAVRLAFEGIDATEPGSGEFASAAPHVVPVATWSLWQAFAESLSLRIALDDVLAESVLGAAYRLDDAMRDAFELCVRAALERMPDALAESLARLES